MGLQVSGRWFLLRILQKAGGPFPVLAAGGLLAVFGVSWLIGPLSQHLPSPSHGILRAGGVRLGFASLVPRPPPPPPGRAGGGGGGGGGGGVGGLSLCVQFSLL